MHPGTIIPPVSGNRDRVEEPDDPRPAESATTGEWIVFAKQDDEAYYLTLGAHTEDDEAIWRRCKACASEFPGLRIIQEDRG